MNVKALAVNVEMLLHCDHLSTWMCGSSFLVMVCCIFLFVIWFYCCYQPWWKPFYLEYLASEYWWGPSYLSLWSNVLGNLFQEGHRVPHQPIEQRSGQFLWWVSGDIAVWEADKCQIYCGAEDYGARRNLVTVNGQV